MYIIYTGYIIWIMQISFSSGVKIQFLSFDIRYVARFIREVLLKNTWTPSSWPISMTLAAKLIDPSPNRDLVMNFATKSTDFDQKFWWKLLDLNELECFSLKWNICVRKLLRWKFFDLLRNSLRHNFGTKITKNYIK